MWWRLLPSQVTRTRECSRGIFTSQQRIWLWSWVSALNFLHSQHILKTLWRSVHWRFAIIVSSLTWYRLDKITCSRSALDGYSCQRHTTSNGVTRGRCVNGHVAPFEPIPRSPPRSFYSVYRPRLARGWHLFCAVRLHHSPRLQSSFRTNFVQALLRISLAPDRAAIPNSFSDACRSVFHGDRSRPIGYQLVDPLGTTEPIINASCVVRDLLEPTRMVDLSGMACLYGFSLSRFNYPKAEHRLDTVNYCAHLAIFAPDICRSRR